MSTRMLTLLIGIVLPVAGCGGRPVPPDKLAEAIVGTWKAKDGNGQFRITFWPSGEFRFSNVPPKPLSGEGKWKFHPVSHRLLLQFGYVEPPEANLAADEWVITITTDGLLKYSSDTYWKKERTLVRVSNDPGKNAGANALADIPAGKLARTVVVPTLGSPLAPGQSAMWCATLPMAWQQMESAVLNGHVNLVGAEEISRELSTCPRPDLPDKDYYVAAGFYKDGIVDRINAEVAKRFSNAPRAQPPKSPLPMLLAYAYLEAIIPFEFVFHDSPEPLKFTDSRGQTTPVKAFGMLEADKEQGNGTFRSQVSLLYRQADEFALDLSKNTKPYQLILARMERKETLQATLDELAKRISGSHGALAQGAVVLLPNMDWKIDHHFPELVDKELRHPSFPPDTKPYVVDAQQSIRFRLDRRGAILRSSAIMPTDWGDGVHVPYEYFRFDRPYLIVLRVRDSQRPFFVMWVDNAELLVKQ